LAVDRGVRLFDRLAPNRQPQFVLATSASKNPNLGIVLRRLFSLEAHLGSAEAAWQLGGAGLQQTLQHEILTPLAAAGIYHDNLR
jgi:hypothetical protein